MLQKKTMKLWKEEILISMGEACTTLTHVLQSVAMTLLIITAPDSSTPERCNNIGREGT